jgi:hypothetical protein
MTQVHHRKFMRDVGGKDGGGGNSAQLGIYTAVPVDDQFLNPYQIRWSSARNNLLVGDGQNVRIMFRNANLSFSSKQYTGYSFRIDSDNIDLYGAGASAIRRFIDFSFSNYLSLSIASIRTIDASGDPFHVYVTSNNATDGHGVRMITKSTMLVTGGGTPVQILATGTGDNQFTNPLGVLYIATNADAGFLYVCEATRICKIAVVTTAGSESFTWNTSYAIAANDLAWDGTNFYVQSSTQTIKYDNVFTDATKVATACVGYSITHIPDQSDGYGATLAIVDSINSHLERRKCSDLSAINSVGSAGDGSTSLFDPTFATAADAYIDFYADDGQSGTMVRTGSAGAYTHAHSKNGFSAIFFTSAGPHRVAYRVRGGLGLVTEITADSDAISSIRNLDRCPLIFIQLNSNASLILSTTELRRVSQVLYIAGCPVISGTLDTLHPGLVFVSMGGSLITGTIAQLPRNIYGLYISSCPNLTGNISDFPTGLQIGVANNTSLTASSITTLIAIRDLRIYSMGWLTADVDTVLKSISDAIHLNAAHFTYATPALQIGGTNQAPSGASGIEGTSPLVTPGSGNSDTNWLWDAALSKHKALSGRAAIYIMRNNAGHIWTVTATDVV